MRFLRLPRAARGRPGTLSFHTSLRLVRRGARRRRRFGISAVAHSFTHSVADAVGRCCRRWAQVGVLVTRGVVCAGRRFPKRSRGPGEARGTHVRDARGPMCVTREGKLTRRDIAARPHRPAASKRTQRSFGESGSQLAQNENTEFSRRSRAGRRWRRRSCSPSRARS